MIGLDFGILYTLNAQIETDVATKSGFRIVPSNETQTLFDNLQMIHRVFDSTLHVFASEIIGNFNESVAGDRIKNTLTALAREVVTTSLIYIADRSLVEVIDLNYRRSDLPQLAGLPLSFKPVYFVGLDKDTVFAPLDKTSIVGLAPSAVLFEKSAVQTITSKRNGEIVRPIAEDENIVQYDFSNVPPGLYEITLDEATPVVRDFYNDTALYARPPFAIAEITTAEGGFTVQEYTIEFKKKVI